MSKLSDLAFMAATDMRAIQQLIRKLEKPLTSPNWSNEAALLRRQIERAVKSLKDLDRALEGSPPPQ